MHRNPWGSAELVKTLKLQAVANVLEALSPEAIEGGSAGKGCGTGLVKSLRFDARWMFDVHLTVVLEHSDSDRREKIIRSGYAVVLTRSFSELRCGGKDVIPLVYGLKRYPVKNDAPVRDTGGNVWMSDLRRRERLETAFT